jgi:predicted ester cyclase
LNYYTSVVYGRSVSKESVERDPTAIAREAIEIVCSGNIDRVGEYYSADLIDHVNDKVHLGHDGLMQSYALYRAIFGSWRFEVLQQVTEGDRVASRWVLRANRRGREVELRGITISSVDDQGRVSEDWGYSDTVALLGQLGVLRTLLLGAEILVGRVKFPKDER